jgi:Ca-activated chloride channel homolog
VRIESSDNSEVPRNFLSTSMVITSTDGVTSTAGVFQQSPGVYGGVIKNLKEGVYQVGIEQRESPGGKLAASQVTGLVVPYPSEYRLAASSSAEARALLADLAQLGGGRVLPLDDPAQALTHDIVSQPRSIPLWPYLLTMAILLFPLDVAVRRLTVTRADLRRALSVLSARR